MIRSVPKSDQSPYAIATLSHFSRNDFFHTEIFMLCFSSSDCCFVSPVKCSSVLQCARGMSQPYLPISVEEIAAITTVDHWTNRRVT
jgi:hypothetical protein